MKRIVLLAAALLDEANWQGALDGAIRFVRGDALVGLLIALINLVAGTLLHQTTIFFMHKNHIRLQAKMSQTVRMQNPERFG